MIYVPVYVDILTGETSLLVPKSPVILVEVCINGDGGRHTTDIEIRYRASENVGIG